MEKRLEQIEKDLVHARDHADRSAQIRVYNAVPWLIARLRERLPVEDTVSVEVVEEEIPADDQNENPVEDEVGVGSVVIEDDSEDEEDENLIEGPA